jgi:RimJ/RimL family protein N-acetyltransferase
MEEIAKELDLHRIHVTVDAANLVALKWIRAMKFQKEGLLKSYTYDKKDMIMYSRIFAR